MTTEVEGISKLALAAQAMPVVIPAAEGREFVALPLAGGGYKLEQITSANKAEVLLPKFVTQAPSLQDAHSLVTYVNRFKNSDTVLFADIKTSTILALIDYHKQPAEGQEPTARLNLHRASLVLPFSIEWQTWSECSGKLMSHVDFATFLEENSQDVAEPAGAALLEVCRDLQVKSGMNFNSVVRSGDYASVEFQKSDDVSTKENMQLPLSIKLKIPVYFGEEPVDVTAFLRRKINDGRLQLGYVMSRAENVRQDEFHRIAAEIEQQVELDTVYGKPA